jgi:hypothetical protein
MRSSIRSASVRRAALELQSVAHSSSTPLIIIAKGLEAYSGGWDGKCSTIGPDDELRCQDLLQHIPARYRELCLCVNAFGGSSVSAFNISTQVRARFDRITCYVPHVAASAGALLALSADAIVMSRCAYLTMLDPMLRVAETPIPAARIARTCGNGGGWSPEQVAFAQDALRMVEDLLDAALAGAGYPEDGGAVIKGRLLFHDGFHDAPIFRDELRGAGVKVESDSECDASPILRRLERAFRLLACPGGTSYVAAFVPVRSRRRR